LIPVPPLDGGKILGLLVPKRWENGYMRFQNKGIKYFVIFMLVDIFILGNLFGFSIVQFIVMNVYELVRNAILFGM
jgi:Zn-dependent protease